MILTACHYGHSRSVCAARELHSRGIDAVACGLGTAGGWLPHLFEAADRIIIMDRDMISQIPREFWGKVRTCHVGPDKWSNPYNRELAELVRGEIEGCLT